MSAEVRRRQRADGNLLLCATKSPDLPVRLGARGKSINGPVTWPPPGARFQPHF